MVYEIGPKLRTIPKLGWGNVLAVAGYRTGVSAGLYRTLMPTGTAYSGPFFHEGEQSGKARHNTKSDAVFTKIQYFSDKYFDIGSPPNWFKSPITGELVSNPRDHWTIPTQGIRDIKLIWEPSRFHWLFPLAKTYAKTGDRAALDLMNNWVGDWVKENPLYQGPNWKCGQEASLRCLVTLTAAALIGADKFPEPALIRFVIEHLNRISRTLRYARAQDNNHGTSEAAALLIGGAWLSLVDPSSQGKTWAADGRAHLEERVTYLISSDGSFSQRSTNYHRLVLDTLTLVNFWQRHLKISAFSSDFYERASAATLWLLALCAPNTGLVPNFGANDGAYLLSLSTLPFCDFRPSLQAAAISFLKKRAFPVGPWDDLANWLNLVATDTEELQRPELRSRHGYWTLTNGNAWAFFHTPRFNFRPSQADILHLDIWHSGHNLCRDLGSFSYSLPDNGLQEFAGTRAHNTVECDGKDQMPRLGRFLFGEWPSVEVTNELDSVRAKFTNYLGINHERTLTRISRGFEIKDRVSGFKELATVRWHLAPGDWKLEGNSCCGAKSKITFLGDTANLQISLEEAFESRHYYEKSPIPVLTVKARGTEASFITQILFDAE